MDTIPPEQLTVPVELLKVIAPRLEQRICGKGQFKIFPLSKTWGNCHLKGLLKRYKDRAEVLYSASMNTCWKRFVICKEMSHLLIDTESKHFTYNPMELVQQLITGAPSLTLDDRLASEHLAVISAIEILLPFQLRGRLKEMLSSGNNDRHIAQEFRVPENVVTYLVRSKYWEVSEACATTSRPPQSKP
jgi:Zn-dependent peptidase ImmA (M78 family)